MCGYQFETTTKRSINASRLGQNKMLGSNFSQQFNHLNMKIASSGKAYPIFYFNIYGRFQVIDVGKTYSSCKRSILFRYSSISK